tara:strand:- start:6542 stop:6691 length:150 start_codon:yes stop_codon:yes gene_type:complete
MTGEVTGGYTFILLSYGIAGVTLIALAAWTFSRLMSAKKRLKMLEQGDA